MSKISGLFAMARDLSWPAQLQQRLLIMSRALMASITFTGFIRLLHLGIYFKAEQSSIHG